MRADPKKQFERLLELVKEKDPQALEPLILEARRRGEIGGVVDLPFRFVVEMMEKARLREDSETALSLVKYSRHLFRMWEAFGIVVDNWVEASQKADKGWGPVVTGGKWHQIGAKSNLPRCGSGGKTPITNPILLEKISGGGNSSLLCQRCLTEVKKNWRTIRDLENNKIEGMVRRKLNSWSYLYPGYPQMGEKF